MTEFAFEYARNHGTIDKVGQLNPLGRFGIPEGASPPAHSMHYSDFGIETDAEIAQVALFFASGGSDLLWVLAHDPHIFNSFRPIKLRQWPDTGRRRRALCFASGLAWSMGVIIIRHQQIYIVLFRPIVQCWMLPILFSCVKKLPCLQTKFIIGQYYSRGQ
jgi:hypothetical protein